MSLASVTDGVVWAREVTDADGRVVNGLGGVVEMGLWRITFALGEYFGAQDIAGAMSVLDVTLSLNEDRHYHVPVLATPNSATTYLGT